MARSSPKSPSIDRHALVSRHNVVLTALDAERPLQVGNGEFAFGMDITGLQSFVPFNTMSQWGWHSTPLPPGKRIEDFEGQIWDTHGRPIRYPMPDPLHPEISDWLAANPHKINLGRIGLELIMRDGSVATQTDIRNPRQELDLWTGIVTSWFELEGESVTVVTACHPTLDAVAARVESPLIKAKRLSVFLDVPGNNPLQFANFVGDWTAPGRLELIDTWQAERADFTRTIDEDRYRVSLTWQTAATLKRGAVGQAPPLDILSAEYGAKNQWADVTAIVRRDVHNGAVSVQASNTLAGDPIHGVEKTLRVKYLLGGKELSAEIRENGFFRVNPLASVHGLILSPSPDSSTLSFVCAFSPQPLAKKSLTAEESFAACRRSWPAYWKSGGAIDLSESRDPRWKELERRIVLSQYLMKVNEAGSLPPQESGLVNNGWFGKFHLEMVWWHAAHWALWNRWPELDRSMGLYASLLEKAKKRAEGEGFQGARWPKCIGPTFREWPHEIHSLLIWQQPHPIFFAEMDYRAHPTKATLRKWAPIVESTADFLASYAFFDKEKGKYVLGPPMVVVSENTNSRITTNPAFELSYWRFGLRTAQEWRKRLGLSRRPNWDKVLNDLSPLPVQNEVYVLYEGVRDMWTKFNFEHPALTGAFGLLPGDGVDVATMRRTLDQVRAAWDFNHTWGWDFPMLAMCAARLGEADRAVDFLLTSAPGFQFDDRGLATGGPFPYFPSNGGLLYAVAMMAAGWDGAPTRNSPGFPTNGQWFVRSENLSRAQ